MADACWDRPAKYALCVPGGDSCLRPVVVDDPLGAILADGLQHPVTARSAGARGLVSLYEGAFGEGNDRLGNGGRVAGDGSGGFQGETASEG